MKVLKQYGQVSGKCDGDIQGAGIVDGGIGGVIDGGIGGVVDSGIGGIVDGGVIFCEKKSLVWRCHFFAQNFN